MHAYTYTEIFISETNIYAQYVYELLLLLSTDAPPLREFERKVIRKTFGTVRVGDDICIQSNSELYELLNDIYGM